MYCNLAGIRLFQGAFPPASVVKIFECCCARYWWNEASQGFEKVLGLGEDIAIDFFLEQEGLSKDEQIKRQEVMLVSYTSPVCTKYSILLFSDDDSLPRTRSALKWNPPPKYCGKR